MTKNSESLKRTKIRGSGWEFSKKYYFHTKELHGVTKKAPLNCQGIAYCSRLKGTGCGRAGGKSKKIPSFRIEKAGHTLMISMDL
jgi:hypothetical protein